MKKRRMIAAAAFLMGGAALVEIQTGWLFGSEANAAGAAGGGALMALSIPLPGSMLAGSPWRRSDAAPAATRAPTRVQAEADEKPADQAGGDAGGAQIAARSAEMPLDAGSPFLVLNLGGNAPAPQFAVPGVADDGGLGAGNFGSGGAGQAVASAASLGDTISGVPEPASWISLIAGLMLVGVNVRNRRSARSVAS